MKRKLGRKNDVRTTLVSFDIRSDFKISSRTLVVAVAVNAITGISNCKDFSLPVVKFSLNADSRLKQGKTFRSIPYLQIATVE
jgi:hypothetical protein